MKTCLRHISRRHIGGIVDARQLEVRALSRLTLTPCGEVSSKPNPLFDVWKTFQDVIGYQETFGWTCLP